jgi:arginyl-tRNA synthetase
VITAELRRAILAAAGHDDADPLLRPGPVPGSYASSLPFRLAGPGRDPRDIAAWMAAGLGAEPWIAAAQVTGRGYLAVTVTHDALAGLAVRIAQAGPASAASDALRGHTMTAPADPDLAAEPDWRQAQATLAAHLTARLAATAGATVIFSAERPMVPLSLPQPAAPPEAERSVVSPSRPRPAAPPERPKPPASGPPAASSPDAERPTPPAPRPPLAAAIAYAGPDAVRFALARTPPGTAPPPAEVTARHLLTNPAYAVRYAHAAAAAVLRWAVALGIGPAGPQEFRPRLLLAPQELALLDALSWLPERVAMAARRGRPDEFAGYVERLAARTMDTMSTTGFTKVSSISSERLWLAEAARAGLAACLGLLGVSAPRRL